MSENQIVIINDFVECRPRCAGQTASASGNQQRVRRHHHLRLAKRERNHGVRQEGQRGEIWVMDAMIGWESGKEGIDIGETLSECNAGGKWLRRRFLKGCQDATIASDSSPNHDSMITTHCHVGNKVTLSTLKIHTIESMALSPTQICTRNVYKLHKISRIGLILDPSVFKHIKLNT